MIDQQSLAGIVRDLLDRGGEGVYWDFKLKHHANKGDLVHDVLCLANAAHDGPRFLVFGVKDEDWLVQSIEEDVGRRSQADIATLFRDNAGRFFQSRFPTSHLREIEIDGALIDVLVIEDEPKKPYYLVERIGGVRPHHVYTRVCDTNTPVDDAAQPHEIERMWRQRFGLDVPALERARRCLWEADAWSISEEDGFDCWHHDVFPEFTVRSTAADSVVDSSQEWTRGEVRTDNNTSGWYELPLPPDTAQAGSLCRLRRPQEERRRSRLRGGGQGALLFLQDGQCGIRGAPILVRVAGARRLKRPLDTRRRRDRTRGEIEMATRTRHTCPATG